MLTMVSVVPPSGAFWAPLSIPVQAPNPDGAFITDVGGIDPVQAEITSKGYGFIDGEFPVGQRVGKRNIVLKMTLEARDHPISEVRRSLYGYFMPKMPVTLQFDFSDRDSVQIDGWVESFEGDRWAEDPEMQASIICPKPYFRAEEQATATDTTGVDPDPIEVLVDGDQLIGFQLRIPNDTDVDFLDDIIIETMTEGSEPGEYFSHQEMHLSNVDLAPGEFLWLDTNVGQKEIKIDYIPEEGSGDFSRNALIFMTDGSSWPRLIPGPNLIKVSTPGDGTPRVWDLMFYPKFGGL